jgi:dephospho-CoA kinase
MTVAVATGDLIFGAKLAAADQRRDDFRLRLLVGGEPSERARSEPIKHPAKKKRHTEKDEQPESCASEGIFAPRWHVNMPLGWCPLSGRS